MRNKNISRNNVPSVKGGENWRRDPHATARYSTNLRLRKRIIPLPIPTTDALHPISVYLLCAPNIYFFLS